MKLVSWNLNGLEDRHLDVRTEAAMFQILLGAPIELAIKEDFKANSPDIILLQEVVERSYHAHIVPHLKAAGFTIYPPEPTERSYFEVVAVRSKKIDASYQSFEYSQQGRGLTTLNLNGLTVMTAHLESMKPGKSMRIEQAECILDAMQKCGPSFFAGDTNLRTSEWNEIDHSKIHNNTIKDAWTSFGEPKVHRMTWFNETEGSNAKSRFDRAWLNQLNLKSFETFGKENIPTIGSRASDHLGLRIEISPH